MLIFCVVIAQLLSLVLKFVHFHDELSTRKGSSINYVTPKWGGGGAKSPRYALSEKCMCYVTQWVEGARLACYGVVLFASHSSLNFLQLAPTSVGERGGATGSVHRS